MASKRQSFKKGVESALHARDRTGVQDFVLLEDFRSVDVFMDNLRKRFKADLIYVSVLETVSLDSFGIVQHRVVTLLFVLFLLVYTLCLRRDGR